MKAEFINPFIQGAESILSTVCFENLTLGKVYLKSKPYPNATFIEIEIIGALTGKVFYSMSEDTACSIASKMMMGMPVNEIDDMSQSALCELSNMISGNVATIFSNLGKIIDIKPPLFNNNSSRIEFEKLLCVPLTLSNGKQFEINLWLEE